MNSKNKSSNKIHNHVQVTNVNLLILSNTLSQQIMFNKSMFLITVNRHLKKTPVVCFLVDSPGSGILKYKYTDKYRHERDAHM